jgi:hypothetical protein
MPVAVHRSTPLMPQGRNRATRRLTFHYPHDSRVRRRATLGNLTAIQPYQFTISTKGEEIQESRSPAIMRNACEALIFSTFRFLADHLTVFHGAGIAGGFLPSEVPSKSFAWGTSGQPCGAAPTLVLQGLALAGDRSREMPKGPFHSHSIVAGGLPETS